MEKNWQYLKYIVRHKWFVLVAGLKFKVPLWRLIIHDWSKLMPVEWAAYREFFYGERGPDGSRPPLVKAAFKRAWLHHIHLNPHHWNHYVYTDTDGTETLEMPETYLREMLADWWGAGRAVTGRWRADEWYEENKSNIVFHPETRDQVEKRLTSVNFERVSSNGRA